jgi:hypothetical protein
VRALSIRFRALKSSSAKATNSEIRRLNIALSNCNECSRMACGTELMLHRFKFQHCLRQARGRLVREEDSGRVLHSSFVWKDTVHGFQHATGGISNHVSPEALCLDRDDTEILFSRKEQRTTPRKILAQFAVAHPSEKSHRRSGHSAESLFLRTTTDNFQTPAQFRNR